MKRPSLTSRVVLMAGLCLAGTQAANAAFISIDDYSVPGQISAFAGDFENGIMIDTTSTSGLGNSITVPAAAAAGPLTFAGSWIDEGLSTPGVFAQIFGTVAQLVYTVSTDGLFGTISANLRVTDQLLHSPWRDRHQCRPRTEFLRPIIPDRELAGSRRPRARQLPAARRRPGRSCRGSSSPGLGWRLKSALRRES